MAGGERISFDTDPSRYRHWRLEVDAPVATLTHGRRPRRRPARRLRAEAQLLRPRRRHRARRRRPAPALRAPGGARGRASRAASTRSSAPAPTSRCWPASTHPLKVNFCKFTNETRLAIEDATAHSGQVWLAAVNGTAAGGGYELALACDEIVLVDDGTSAVSLPEVPLLGVLPGTGGLTRVVDKRQVRRDLADVFSTRAEGVQGQAGRRVGPGRRGGAAQPLRRRRSRPGRAAAAASRTARRDGPGIALTPLARDDDGDAARYPHVDVRHRPRRWAPRTVTVHGPSGRQPPTPAELVAAGAAAWPLAACRELDDALLAPALQRARDRHVGAAHRGRPGRGARRRRRSCATTPTTGWCARSGCYWARDAASASTCRPARLFAARSSPGAASPARSAELALAADRSFMLDGTPSPTMTAAAVVVLTDVERRLRTRWRTA